MWWWIYHWIEHLTLCHYHLKTIFHFSVIMHNKDKQHELHVLTFFKQFRLMLMINVLKNYINKHSPFFKSKHSGAPYAQCHIVNQGICLYLNYNELLSNFYICNVCIIFLKSAESECKFMQKPVFVCILNTCLLTEILNCCLNRL